jgi:hypothetical protein
VQGFGSIKFGPVEISWGQPYPRSEVPEPNHLDRNHLLTRLDIVGEGRSVHEPSLISSIVIQGLRCFTGWVVAGEPHVRSVGIELSLDMSGEVVTSVDDHPNVCRLKPSSSDEVP